MPILPTSPVHECHRSVLSVGTIDPEAGVLPVAGADRRLVPAGSAGVVAAEPDEVQAAAARSRARPAASVLAPAHAALPPGRDIGIPPSCPTPSGAPAARPPAAGRHSGGGLAPRRAGA